jgi:hypothetical protein
MSSPESCILNANPDICGIGVRSALYIQAFIDPALTLLAPKNDKLRTSVCTTFITATGLIISAFIQSRVTGGLSLFEAVLTTQLITIKLAGIIRFPRGYVALVAATLFQAMYVAFLFWVWARVREFGSQPECNNFILFPIFGHTVSVTSRWLQILVLVLNSCVAFGRAVRLCCLVPSKSQTGQRPYWVLTPMIAGQLGAIIYLIVTTEQFIQDNQVNDAMSQWTFGQTLAVLLLIPSLLELYQQVIERRKDEPPEARGTPAPNGPMARYSFRGKTQI